MERIGQQAYSSTHVRLCVAMGTHGKDVRLAARHRANKVATVLQSVVRKHPIVNTLDDPMNNSGFEVGKVFWFRKQMERKRREAEPRYSKRHATSGGFSFGL